MFSPLIVFEVLGEYAKAPSLSAARRAQLNAWSRRDLVKALQDGQIRRVRLGSLRISEDALVLVFSRQEPGADDGSHGSVRPGALLGVFASEDLNALLADTPADFSGRDPSSGSRALLEQECDVMVIEPVWTEIE